MARGSRSRRSEEYCLPRLLHHRKMAWVKEWDLGLEMAWERVWGKASGMVWDLALGRESVRGVEVW